MNSDTQTLNTYSFGNRPMRTIIDNTGAPWWVARDVMVSLEFSAASLTNVAKMVAHVPEDWKGRYPITTPSGDQEMITLSEQGLYFFLGRSDKPTALPLQRWVAGEVLPAIRKTGTYSIQSRPLRDMTVAQARLYIEREDRLEAIIKQQVAMSAQLDEISRLARPTAYSQRNMMLDEELIWFDDTARLLGTKPHRLLKFLREHGVLSNEVGKWNRPVKKYVDEGYFHPVRYRYYKFFTIKGRIWMRHNASMGWLDSILDREALLNRLSTAVDLPRPLDFEPKPC